MALRAAIELGLTPVGPVLTDRVEGVIAWDELDDDQRTVFCVLRAAFAGFLAHADTQPGRLPGDPAGAGLVAEHPRRGDVRPRVQPRGRAMAGNTPFRR